MGKKRKRSECAEDIRKCVGRSHIRFEFNSQTFVKVLEAFGDLETDSEVLSNEDVTITVTKREYLDSAIKFSMADVAKRTNANVTVHLYPGTQALMVQGKTGTIMHNHPFVSFTDIFLEPFLSRLIKDSAPGEAHKKTNHQEEDEKEDVESEKETAERKEVEQEKEKEKSIEQESSLPLDTSRIASEVDREDKNLRETIRYNACGYFESQAERYRQTITNLNLKQRETRLKLAEELQLTDELKRTNKNEREENIREKHKLYIQLDNEEKAIRS